MSVSFRLGIRCNDAKLAVRFLAMTDADRMKLRFGPYATPLFEFGQVVTDVVRDRDVVTVGVSNGRIPWPIGKSKGGRARGLIVFGALSDAARTESNQAVATSGA